MDAVFEAFDGPFVWGRSDCCTAACDAFAALHGVDPMASLRGRYSTRIGAALIIHRAGGFIALAEGLAARAGLVPSDGGAGDIGVALVGEEHALVIGLGGGMWAGKVDGGFQTVRGAGRAWSCRSF